jgi:hypothetical protein
LSCLLLGKDKSPVAYALHTKLVSRFSHSRAGECVRSPLRLANRALRIERLTATRSLF